MIKICHSETMTEKLLECILIALFYFLTILGISELLQFLNIKTVIATPWHAPFLQKLGKVYSLLTFSYNPMLIKYIVIC